LSLWGAAEKSHSFDFCPNSISRFIGILSPKVVDSGFRWNDIMLSLQALVVPVGCTCPEFFFPTVIPHELVLSAAEGMRNPRLVILSPSLTVILSPGAPGKNLNRSNTSDSSLR